MDGTAHSGGNRQANRNSGKANDIAPRNNGPRPSGGVYLRVPPIAAIALAVVLTTVVWAQSPKGPSAGPRGGGSPGPAPAPIVDKTPAPIANGNPNNAPPPAPSTTGGAAQPIEAMWIWSKIQNPDDAPLGGCFFRRSFLLDAPGAGRIEITADDAFELYLNGKLVGSSDKSKVLQRFDVSELLVRGRNVVAVKVTNKEGKSAGVAARVFIQNDKKWLSASTDDTWRSSLKETPNWQSVQLADRSWDAVQIIGKLIVPKEPVADAKSDSPARPELPPTPAPPPSVAAKTPAATDPAPAVSSPAKVGQEFKLSDEFRVERLMIGEDLGSLIAMTFNEFGQLLIARENGPLQLVYDSHKDKRFDKVRVVCDKVKNCQGILALNGEILVTAEGPDGVAVYRLADKNHDGVYEDVTAVLKFEGELGEHGPHGLTLGPDGMIYLVAGNHNKPQFQYAASSPYKRPQEGDLVTRYEDPTGHAAGVKAPCGTVIRFTPDGDRVELVAGGLRNCYDLAFNREGELFTHDSDHEADEGSPWYRTTRMFHVTSGAEFGWRSGWAPRPEEFLDTLPPVVDTGRGSPTGMAFYDHFAFPVRYHNSLFVGDWAQGRIWNVKLDRKGASFAGKSSVFLEGNPLTVTDLEVGPDGALYFVTGGRGTEGGLYRVIWKGEVPEDYKNLGEGITAAVRQPQLQSSWSRQQLATVQRGLGDDWNKQAPGVARAADNPYYYRLRALDLMQLYGPAPDNALLLKLSQDKDPEVRAKAAEFLGRSQAEPLRDRLRALLSDDSPLVRRKACEAIAAGGITVAAERLAPILRSDDRFESWAARKALEALPPAEWRDELLGSKDPKVFSQAALAALSTSDDKDQAIRILEGVRERLSGEVSDPDFVDWMRLTQLALAAGKIKPDDAADIRDALAKEYPTANPLMNRELVRVLVYLQADAAVDRFFAQLHNEKISLPEKMHLALHLRYLENGLSKEQRLEVLGLYEKWIAAKDAAGYARYLPAVARDMARQCGEPEARQIVLRGVEWPHAALGALYKLPPQLDSDLIAAISKMDKQLDTVKGDGAKRLQTGFAAVLARSADAESMAYLRQIYDRDPERRYVVAMGLAQEPDGENWPYLVRSLSLVEGGAAREVLERLRSVSRVPQEPEAIRQTIIRGLKLQKEGAPQAVALLEHWTGEQHSKPGDAWDVAIAGWQEWFIKKYPNLPEPKLPADTASSKWKMQDVLEELASADAPEGDASRGALVFEKANCLKCHRYGERGERIGPDLTALSKRFSTKEIVESILYPSLVISDQYQAKNVLTTDGRTILGLVSANGGGEITILQSNGQKLTLQPSEVDRLTASKVSVMPEGLLNELSIDDIADLITYLRTPPGEIVSQKPGPAMGTKKK